jgi:hypothetical protein
VGLVASPVSPPASPASVLVTTAAPLPQQQPPLLIQEGNGQSRASGVGWRVAGIVFAVLLGAGLIIGIIALATRKTSNEKCPLPPDPIIIPAPAPAPPVGPAPASITFPSYPYPYPYPYAPPTPTPTPTPAPPTPGNGSGGGGGGGSSSGERQCRTSAECTNGTVCVGGRCQTCSSLAPCPEGQVCHEGACQARAGFPCGNPREPGTVSCITGTLCDTQSKQCVPIIRTTT